MATVGHVIVGAAAGLLVRPPPGVRRRSWCLTLAAVSLAPDLDVAAFALGIPYGAPFGHRGATHSCAAPLLLGLAAWVSLWARGNAWARPAVTIALVWASHGLLDTLTDGGLGAALLWPFSYERFFAPWRPLPVAPVGPRLLAPSGVALMVRETVMFLPVLAVAWAAGRRSTARGQWRPR